MAEVAAKDRDVENRTGRLSDMVAGGGTKTVTTEPFALEPAMTVDRVLQGVGRECLTELLRQRPTALAGDLEAFHRMRVALRRLRSVVSALKEVLPSEQYQWAQHELTWLANSLGPVRDWDVFASDLFATVREVLPEGIDLSRLAETAKLRRDAAYETAKEALRSSRYAKSIQKLARWFESCGWRHQATSEVSPHLVTPIASLAPGLIERRWRQVRKRSKGFAKLSLAERHKLRIAVKRLRYMVEFLGGLFDEAEVRALIKRLKLPQEELGHLNDVRTAKRLIKEIIRPTRNSEVSEDAGLVLGWYIRGAADAEAKLRKHVRRLRKAKPFWRSPHPKPTVEGRDESPARTPL